MYIERLYTNCLAEASYYLESDGEAAVIDPMREPEPYLALARERGTVIRYIFETHFHADFISGHIDLARKTGATIIYGPQAEAGYQIVSAADGQEFPLGHIRLKVLHTPGHTLESSCFLVLDEKGRPDAVFTGDTLFVGEVGRPDLAVKSTLSKEDLAGMLYHSLETRIKMLPDDVIVYPGHGAGSACGKNIGKEISSTIGEQKKYNYALQPMSEEDFVRQVTDRLPEPPQYFFMDAAINKSGYESIDKVLERNARALTINEFETEIKDGAVVLDAREASSFEKGFVPGAINIGLNGQYAVWVGTLLDANTPLVLVTEEGSEKEAIMRLARVGYEKVKGYLQGGVKTWTAKGNPTDTITSIEPEDLHAYLDKDYTLLDIRNRSECQNGMVKGAASIPLSSLEKSLQDLNPQSSYIIYCAGGYRSMIACSLLRRKGFKNLINVHGGYSKMRSLSLPVAFPDFSPMQ